MDKLQSFLHQCATSVTRGVIVVAIAFILFSVMEGLFALHRIRKPWRATLLDLQYALLSMFYSPFIHFFLAIVFGLMAMRAQGSTHDPQISPLSFAAQLLVLLFLRDGLIYFRHRIFHLPQVWVFHSVHHSSEEVTWISAARFHPVESVIEATGEILLFFGCVMFEMDPLVLSVAGLIIGFYNMFIHSNLAWTFGPLRYVFVSPVLHRWHHSDEAVAADKNFAAMFSCLDVMFGTFYMPKDLLPTTTGLSTSEKAVYPKTMAGQLVHPFRKQR